MCDIENCNPQGSDRPTVSASDRRLFMQGLMATDRDQARAQTRAVKGNEAGATISHWVRWTTRPAMARPLPWDGVLVAAGASMPRWQMIWTPR